MTESSQCQPSRLVRTLIVFTVMASISAMMPREAVAATETVIYNFMGPPDGSNGYGGLSYNLVQNAGHFYGVTSAGGTYDAEYGGLGTVFELSFQNGAWVEQVIHSFGGPGDGWRPNGNPVMDGDGNLYGVLLVGTGVSDIGAVFKLSPDGDGTWAETILTSPNVGPHVPVGGLTLDAAGNLYGVTLGGGAGTCDDGSCGTIFELSPPAKNAKKWKFTKLYRFFGPKAGDGSWPNGNLVFDSAGNLYGTTVEGGAFNNGTVFELSPGPLGWTEKILFNFGSPYTDGFYPGGGLIFDDHGNLYGTTLGGGDGCCGAVFELSPSGEHWTEKVLYSFLEAGDGSGPQGPLVFHNGNLYATTRSGGAQQSDVGVVFKLSPSGGTWKGTVLHSFSGPPGDGWEPAGGVIFDRHGNLFGVANGGAYGPYGNGVIYQIPR